MTNDTLDGSGGGDLLDGGNGQDLLFGSDGDDTLVGGTGMDSLFGGAGNDLLNGGNGQDRLFGNSGADTLFGGAQNDTLFGGAGDDIMTGGSGRDTFAFSLVSEEGSDLILDFTTGNVGDRLQLSDVVDENGDSNVDISDLDAGGHNVQGTANSIVITFDSGSSVTLAGLVGSGINSFAALTASRVTIDIV